MTNAGWRMPAALTAAVLALLPPTASAQVVESLGTRALGMGGAFVAVADDATAVYWNPAGLATGAFFSVALDWQDLGGTPDIAIPGAGGRRTEANSTFIGITSLPVGLVYYRQRLDPFAFQQPPPPTADTPPGVAHEPGQLLASLVTHHFGFAAAQTITQGVVVGSVLKLVRGNAADGHAGGAGTGGSDPGERSSNAFDTDLGLMIDARRVRLGLVVRNATEPGFDTPGGTRLTLQRQVRAGVAWLPADRVTVAFDADLTTTGMLAGERRNVAAGVEAWWWNRRVGTRAGARASTLDEGAGAVGSLGVSAGLTRWLWLEGQVTGGGEAPDRIWGVALRAGF
jgi:hypothetical protein